jgi:glucose-1-phosphate adenylyltransferase
MGNDFYQDLDELHHENENNKINVGIGKNCFIKNALVDKNVRIGNNVHINGGKHLDNFTNELYSIKDGIVVIKKGVILSDNFRIE